MEKSDIRARILFGLISGLLMLCLLLVIMPLAVLAEDLVIIADKDFPVDSIDPLDVMEIYTGHYVVFKRFKVHPMDQVDDQEIKSFFLAKVLRFTPDAYKTHWLKWTFKTGRQPPVVLQNSQEVIEAVMKKGGGLGYVWAQEVQGRDGVKVLLRIPVTQ